MSILPVIVGMGGINAAGRSSFQRSFQRMVFGALNAEERFETLADLGSMMGLGRRVGGDFLCADGTTQTPNSISPLWEQSVLEGTLIRRLERFDANRVEQRKLLQSPLEGCTLEIAKRQLPDPLPPHWQVQAGERNGMLQVRLPADTPLYSSIYQPYPVQSAGQIPRGLDLEKLYNARNHPRGLQLAVYAASDAWYSTGLERIALLAQVRPDAIGVYASSSMGQMDEASGGGYSRAAMAGKRTTSKQMPFSFPDMPADFINAYIMGSVGFTTSNIGACASWLYNLQAAVHDIRSGRIACAIVGSSEAPLNPENMEGYRVMGALAEDHQLAALDGLAAGSTPDHSRACRPFSSNCGFVMSESAQYMILMSDELALSLGAHILGAVGDTFINSDGYKKSISKPGVGNYLTVAKSCAFIRAVLGEDSLRKKCFVQAHGTGTPQNRVSESLIFNKIAQTFGISDWLLTAIKAYVGHPTGPAGGDQMSATLGTWSQYPWRGKGGKSYIPGIVTIDHIAEDVHQSHLNILMEHLQVDPQRFDSCLINSKGFGGNNATACVFAPHVAQSMLAKKHGTHALQEYRKKLERTQQVQEKNDALISSGQLSPIYSTDKALNDADLSLCDQEISVAGFPLPLDLRMANPFSDMT